MTQPPFNWEAKKAKIKELNEDNPWRLCEGPTEASEILRRAGEGVLSQEEVASFADMLKNETFEDNYELCFCFRILRYMKAAQYRDLVEKHLYHSTDEYVIGQALVTLCRFGFASEYLDYIKQIIKGEMDYPRGDVFIIAMSCAGDYLKDHFDKELLELLLFTFEDSSEWNMTRALAYDALIYASGETPSRAKSVERNIEANRFDLLDQSPIEKAKQRLKEHQ